MKLVEAVPNFSEGRDLNILKAIENDFSGTSGLYLLDMDVSQSANRTVYTVVGNPKAVEEGLFKAAKTAADLIDMRKHKGIHPRIAALDVCPIIPFKNTSMEECIEISRKLGQRVWQELKIPVYLYEKSADKLQRQNLANCRQGQYEGLVEKMKDPLWRPDIGNGRINQKSGISIIGARDFLIAYNVNLVGASEREAKKIAESVRESGTFEKNINQKLIKKPGKLKYLKAIGWFLWDYNIAQVSTNLINYEKTSVFEVFSTIREEALKLNIAVSGSELIGLIPEKALLDRQHWLEVEATRKKIILENIVELGLNDLKTFDINHKILEYNLKQKGVYEV